MNSATCFRRFPAKPALLFSLLAAPFLTRATAEPTKVHLNAPARGAAAIDALAEHLPDVAKAYGLEAQGLKDLLQSQNDLGVDIDGSLVFACEALAVDEHGALKNGRGKPSADSTANALTVNSSVTQLAGGATIDAFKLHSLPGVTRVIYLDFTGHTTSGTAWNSSYAAGADIVSAPFDLDGDPTTFNDAERGMIQRIWQRVSEDYAPFSVDVTTEDPGLEGIRKTTASDTAYGIHAVISPTNWYGNAGGVAYVGTYGSSSDTPCFIFTQQLANGEKYIAEAVAHEVGHTLGLYHDGATGTNATEYYMGQGNWAPIMGVGYYMPVTQFSKGEYANANNLQDDLAVIAGYIPLAADDHGNTLATATVITGPSVATGGTIETRTDVDVFRFDTGAGVISLNIAGPAPEVDLDIKAELLDATGNVLQVSDSPSMMSASIAGTVSAGTYYLRISGVGNGDPVTSGYSNYASLGNYIITGTLIPTGAKIAPIASIATSTASGVAPLAVNFSGAGSTDADGTIVSYNWAFGNGATATGVTAGYTYTVPGTYVATLTVIDNDGLAGTASVTISVAAPPNVPPVAAASANVTSGQAALAVTFSSTGSTDADGSITSYKWDFGDGTSSTSSAPTKTYTTPGTYSARLTVTDNGGATATSTVSISVLSNPNTDIDVYSYTLASSATKSGTMGNATIVVLDRLARPVAGATVTVQWSGVVSGSSSGKTDSNGRVVLSSVRVKKSGLLTATITNVTPPAGYQYDATIYPQALVRSVTFP